MRSPTYDNRFTALNAFQRDLLVVITHGDPQHGLGIKEDLEEEMDIEVSHGRLYPNLNELVERGLVAKDSVDERTNRYELTDQGRHALRRYHNWVYSDLDLGRPTLDAKQLPTRLCSTVARGRSRLTVIGMHSGATACFVEDVQEHLETAPTLIALVQEVPVTGILRDADLTHFETRQYEAVPIVRAVFCRELAGLSWNGLYEFLSTEHRAVRLGFDSTNFGPYNTAPTRQTLTTAWDDGLSDEAKRTILAVSE